MRSLLLGDVVVLARLLLDLEARRRVDGCPLDADEVRVVRGFVAAAAELDDLARRVPCPPPAPPPDPVSRCEECDRPWSPLRRGMCDRCYRRWRRAGGRS